VQLILLMSKNINHASLAKSGLTVLATVSICVATLAVLRPWADGMMHNAQFLRHPIAEAIDQEAETVAAVTTKRKGKSARREARKRTAKHGSVPLPDKPDPIPLPLRRDSAQQAAVAVASPEAKAKAAATAMPAPEGRMSKAEGDAALAPLLTYSVSDSDIANLKDAIKHGANGDFADARTAMQKIDDPAVSKFALWYSYRAEAPDTTPEQISAFLDDNPLWPSRNILAESVEDALFWREGEPQKILAHFQERRPATGAGKAALGGALIAIGRTDEGNALIRDAWRRHLLTPAIEKRLRKEHKSLLGPEDHLARADYLLAQDNKSRLGAVNRILPLMDKERRPSVKARIAVVERSKRAGSLLSKLEKRDRHEPGVMLARIQWLRRADKDKQAWSLLRSAPKSAETLIDPKPWWVERDAQIRNALNDGNPKTAYALAKDHGGELEEEDLSDAEFLAGWIAFRFLDRADAAHKHFLTSAAAGGLPKRRARASYWLGRTELTLSNERAATARFADAARHSHTFYGQLAHQMIAAADAKASLRTFVPPTEREIEAFTKLDVMKAIMIAQKAKLDSLMPVFLFDLARNLDSAPDMILFCELAIRVAPRHHALRMAKIAMNRSFAVEHYAYPGALPEFNVLGDDKVIEAALVHALTRQESEFNPSTVSSAGAVGLMQLLPSTAKEVARAFDLKFEKDKLTRDPSYNVSLGTAFLYQLIRSYDGSYVMALAGYNAGPGRVRQWVRQFGDPREKTVDPVDWIERIPFTETRDYVHKILESAQIYRSRLDREPAKLQLAEDLHRGRKDKPKFMIGSTAASN
jgi:soluble lytic murein transglycosylase